MRKSIARMMFMLCFIMVYSIPSNEITANAQTTNIDVEAPFATVSNFNVSQNKVKPNDQLKYSFMISFVDAFDYNNEYLFARPFREGEYWVDVCWQSPKKQKIERTYECKEINNAIYIQDSIPIEKGMQAGKWKIRYIRISNLPEEGDMLYIGDKGQKDLNQYYDDSNYYADLSFTMFEVTGVNKKADNKAPSIDLKSLKISDRQIKKSKKKKKITFCVKIQDASSIEDVESRWANYDWTDIGKSDGGSNEIYGYRMKYNKKTKKYYCTFDIYPKSSRKRALYCIYVKDIYGNEKNYSISLDTFAPSKKMRKYYNSYKRMVVSVK